MLVENFWKNYEAHLDSFSFDKTVEEINSFVSKLDGAISEKKPWEADKKGEDISEFLYQLVESLRHLGIALLPFIPEAAEKILTSMHIDTTKINLKEAQKWGGLEKDDIIIKGDALFPRLEKK